MKKYHKDILDNYDKLKKVKNDINLLDFKYWEHSEVYSDLLIEYPELSNIIIEKEKVDEYLHGGHKIEYKKLSAWVKAKDITPEPIKNYLELRELSSILSISEWDDYYDKKIEECTIPILDNICNNLNNILGQNKIQQIRQDLYSGKYRKIKDIQKP